jgi:hypothetical protein
MSLIASVFSLHCNSVSGKPESTYMSLLLQFCHCILIQNQVFIIRFCSQHSYYDPRLVPFEEKFHFHYYCYCYHLNENALRNFSVRNFSIFF